MSPIMIIAVVLLLWFAAGVLAVCLCVFARRGDEQQRASIAARERAVWGRRQRTEPVAVERRSRVAA